MVVVACYQKIKKQLVEEQVVDLDVNSLYPAAYSKIYVVEGTPKVIEHFDWVKKAYNEN